MLLGSFRREAIPGVDLVDGRRYGRTVRLGGKSGVVFAEDAPAQAQVNVDISPSLLPVLMPLLARLRQLFDLDAQPTMVDAQLERGGLGALVRRRPGLRLPGALDGFEIGLRALLHGMGAPEIPEQDLPERVTTALGEPLDSGIPGLRRLAPDAGRVAEAGVPRLVGLGLPAPRAEVLDTFSRAAASGALRLDPGGDMAATHRALLEIGLDEPLATTVVTRALEWPDAFPAADPALQAAAGAASPRALQAKAEKWRPWRAYAALHLRLRHEA